MKRFQKVVLAILVVMVAAGGSWVYLVKFEREKPSVQILPDKKYLGQNLTVVVQDQKSGVAEVQMDASAWKTNTPHLRKIP